MFKTVAYGIFTSYYQTLQVKFLFSSYRDTMSHRAAIEAGGEEDDNFNLQGEKSEVGNQPTQKHRRMFRLLSSLRIKAFEYLENKMLENKHYQLHWQQYQG